MNSRPRPPALQKPITLATRLKRWGLFLVASGFLYLFREWVKMPEWVWDAIIFANALLWYSALWPSKQPAPGKKKPLSRIILELLAVLGTLAFAIAIIAVGLKLELSRNFASALALEITGLLLLLGSLGAGIYQRQAEVWELPETPGNAAPEEKASLVSKLIERIRQI